MSLNYTSITVLWIEIALEKYVVRANRAMTKCQEVENTEFVKEINPISMIVKKYIQQTGLYDSLKLSKAVFTGFKMLGCTANFTLIKVICWILSGHRTKILNK